MFGKKIAVVGATGLVGRTVLKVLDEYGLCDCPPDLYASERSEGKTVFAMGGEIPVCALKRERLCGYDVVFVCAGSKVAEQIVPFAAKGCGLVIDNSSCFRRCNEVPLVVPEINVADVDGKTRVVANPNCSTIQCALPLNALKSFGIKSVRFTTLQAVSGSGQKGINALKHALNGVSDGFYPCDISKSTLPEIGCMTSGGYTEEEEKMIFETRKILHLPDIKISATCIRVPVENCHAASVCVELDENFTLNGVTKAISAQAGVRVCDAPVTLLTQELASGGDDVFVGRIRRDKATENGVCFYCVADNVRRGAASNAVKIAKAIFERNRSL